MKIKVYKNIRTGDQIIVTNDNVTNINTDEKFVLYRFRKETELFIMSIIELKTDWEQIKSY